MQIPENLPHFRKRTLLIVTGEQTARLYLVSDKKVQELDSIEVSSPEYSDREGHFLRTGGGKRYGAGSVYEEKDTSVRNEFLHKVSNKTQKIFREHDIADVILFTPEHVHKETEEKLPPEVQKRITHTLFGNYTKEKPLTLLKRLQKQYTPESNVVATGEARKILDKVKRFLGR